MAAHDVAACDAACKVCAGPWVWESRNELLSRVSNLKRDLQDWRFKLDNQVKSYRSELGDLRKTLNTEVSQLRNEFQVRAGHS